MNKMVWFKAAIKALPISAIFHEVFKPREYPLPSLLREELMHAGLDPEKEYPDKVYIEHGFNPIQINHFRYNRLHKKYRRN